MQMTTILLCLYCFSLFCFFFFFIPSIEKHRHIASMSLGKTERKLHRLGDKLSSIAAAAVTHFTAAAIRHAAVAFGRFYKRGPAYTLTLLAEADEAE